MDIKVISSQIVLVLLFFLATESAGKSVGYSGSNSCLVVSPSLLYPNTDRLAMHPMHDTPFQSGHDTTVSQCPTGTGSVSPGDDFSLRSVCPYEYVVNYDQDRIPASIQEAQCLCGGCLERNGQESFDMDCQPIRYPMTVLRKQSTSNSQHFEYKIEQQQIAVGCACARNL